MLGYIKMFWNVMKGNRLLYLGAIVAVGLATVFSYLPPLIIRLTLDSIIGNQPIEGHCLLVQIVDLFGGKANLFYNLWILGGMIVGASLLQGVFTYFKGKWSAVAAENMARDLRNILYDHLQHLPLAYHSKAETGDLLQRCTSDLETVRHFMAVQITEVGRTLLMMGFVIPIMLSLNTVMTLASTAILPIIFLFSVIFFIKIKKAFLAKDEAESEMSTVLQENLTSIRVVRAFTRQEFEISKFVTKNTNYRDLNYRLLLILAVFWGTSDFMCMLQIAIGTIMGATWAAQGQITLGTMVAFLTYTCIILWPVRQLGRVLAEMGQAVVSLGRIRDILNVPLEEEKNQTSVVQSTGLTGEVVFENVSFSYTHGVPVLDSISFRVKSGQTVAIVGPTGSGKSTLVNLIARMYDITDGRITIDGHDIATFDRKWLRRQIGLVMQEPFLYSRTIGENIALGNPLADESMIHEAARNAHVHEVILGFKAGYQTSVGERGVTLSGGQKQRVAIARALIKNPVILILDDALSAVDTETEMHIQQALKERRGQATTFVIAHRLSSVASADMILVLDHGRIVQRGMHEELIIQDGLYRRVWMIQNAIEEDFVNDAQNESLSFDAQRLMQYKRSSYVSRDIS